VPEFCRDYRYIRTIAVSVFAGREATSFHFGSLRLSLRVLYNLSPVESDQVYIECGRTRHYWHQNPLFIFDDTLMHRSVNYSDRRRYCAFVDVMRPSPVPGVLSVALTVASTMGAVVKNVFYRNWRML
jgi:beta-hydroxylase